MNKVLKAFERTVVYVLIAMMAVVICLAIVDLGWMIVRDMMKPPIFILEVEDLLGIFGFFLLILIGVELLETIKAYLIEHVIHLEIVLEVALIAMARKVIVLDLEKYDGLSVLGIASIVIALGGAYYLERRARREYPNGKSGYERGTAAGPGGNPHDST